MVEASTKCRIAESMGSILRRARLEYGWEIAEVAEHLGIPERWLRQAEADDWSRLPNDAYSRIYFKAYCQMLRLEPKAMYSLYQQTQKRHHVFDRNALEQQRRHPTTAVPLWQMVTAPQVIRRALLVMLGLGLAGYFWWAMANIVTPPRIVLSAPSDGLVTDQRSVDVIGKIDGEVSLRVNGKEITPDPNGNFTDTLRLTEGLNLIKVVGAKKHSKETVVTRRVVVTPEE